MDPFWTLVICVVAILYYLLRRHQGPKNDNEPPMFPGALPIIGHVYLMVGSAGSFWTKFKSHNKYFLSKGGVWSYYAFTHVGYMITDPEDALTVLNSGLEKSDYYQFTAPWVGQGLLTGGGSTWKVHRKVMNPAFNQHMLDGYLEVFNYQGRKIVDALKSLDGVAFNPWNLFRDQAFETICLTLLGIDYSKNPEMITDMAQASEDIMNVLTERFIKLLHNDWLYSFTSLKKKEDALVKKLHDMTNNIIKERSEHLKNNSGDDEETRGKKFKTLLTLLLEAHINEGKLSHKEIREELDTMIAAGHETSFTTLVYTLVLLGHYPEYQERCYKEIMEVVGEGKDVDKYNMNKLVFLEACIKESLRVMPIVAGVARQVTETIKLKNYTLSPGRTAVILLFNMNRSHMWGPKAGEFIPDRWFDLETLPKHPAAFASFGAGRRNCIGKTYAMMVMKTTLAHILRSYKVDADLNKLQLKAGITLKPKEPISMTFTKRKTEE